MREAVADATDATEPVPTMKGPFVPHTPRAPPGSWVSSDSILIKSSEAGVEQAARALSSGPRGSHSAEAGAGPTLAGK